MALTHLARSRRFRERLGSGEPLLGTQLGLTDSTVMEIFGRTGWDWAVIDCEHSAQTPQTVTHMLQAAYTSEIVPVLRPPCLDHDLIRRWLDIGATAIICPFIETAAEARQLIDACQYPPRGRRGWGPRRASDFGLSTPAYLAAVAESIAVLVIIESAQAVSNSAEILAIDGIDGAMIGPMDLSIDLGVFQQWQAPEYLDAVERVRDAAAQTGKAFGAGAYDEQGIAQCIARGESLLLITGDEPLLTSAAHTLAERVRGLIAADNAGSGDAGLR